MAVIPLIPLEFLVEIATEHHLSESELEVLSLALKDRSSNEISNELGGADVVSPDAVRQRLRSVYKKFNLGKESHRKLAKLQTMLLSRYQERQNRKIKKKVLILWSSEGKQLALALKDTILQHEQIEAWVSAEDIAADKVWLPGTQATNQLVENTDFIIGCLTHSSSTWLNFKLGFILGRLNNVKLLQFNRLGGPIANVPLIDGTKKEQLVELFSEIIGDRQKATAWIDRKFPEFELVFESVLKNAGKGKDDLNKDINSVKVAAEGLKENQYIRDNKCFRAILINSLSEISGQLKDTQISYSVPAALYPHHLISLQRELNVRVKALAIVDHEEHFWPEEIGRNIVDSAEEESIRVFVFLKPEDLERNFETLLIHAKEYKVCAMSYQKLTREFPPDFCKDFSIIKAPDDSRVLAEYAGRGLLKTICFTAWDGVSGTVSIHKKMLDKIIASAIPIPKLNENQKNPPIRKIMEEIEERVFKPSLSSAIGMKPIEMSAYIDVEDYDQHEEKHAYYQEMMNRMINMLLEHRGEVAKPYRVLEVGAGTGIFTKRLAKIPNIDLVAVELDWVCFHRLKHSIDNYNSVKVVNDDSCTYVDPVGQFDCIVSSFSDHHIKPKDKKQYFQNLKQNLASKGIIVVGDEFLASHDSNDNDARQVALKNYHYHIIEIAEKEGASVLAQLELDALKSGLEGIGDFKVSCEEYEDLLTTSCLRFAKEKIGPLDRNDIGGVYIYKIRA
ncbi:MAG: methyltransferase domain-containing protein [Aulosira sp. DedQUE10]|nr:methyltransferase domain-containing protein [Aulosira sp. DedQUE10]